MQHTDPSHTQADLDGRGLRIGVVQARFNADITEALATACLHELRNLQVDEVQLQHVQVPGALEVPVALQALALQGGFHALIALGCIIRGETYHFELVANESGSAITQLALTTSRTKPWPAVPAESTWLMARTPILSAVPFSVMAIGV